MSNEPTELAVVTGGNTGTSVATYTPQMVVKIEDAKADIELKRRFMNEVLKNVDGAIIPGATFGSDKDILGKPGAEQLLNAFGMSPELEDVVPPIIDLDGDPENNNEPLVLYRRRCTIYKYFTPDERIMLAVAEGTCTSRETKYRYRYSERECPRCHKPAVRQDSDGPGFYCWRKIGGCGVQFKDVNSDEHKGIKAQVAGRITNPEIADVLHAIEMMADKRALVAATRLATGFSFLVTQDLEDGVSTVIETNINSTNSASTNTTSNGNAGNAGNGSSNSNGRSSGTVAMASEKQVGMIRGKAKGLNFELPWDPTKLTLDQAKQVIKLLLDGNTDMSGISVAAGTPATAEPNKGQSKPTVSDARKGLLKKIADHVNPKLDTYLGDEALQIIADAQADYGITKSTEATDVQLTAILAALDDLKSRIIASADDLNGVGGLGHGEESSEEPVAF